MGLREVKAERTRRAVQEAALCAFETQGYDRTTMEQIAETTGIGIATLYRYFPSKDTILLDPLSHGIGGLARHLETASAGQSIGESLGLALESFLADAEVDSDFARRVRAQLDRAEVPRARLWDLWRQERALLEEAIGRRAGADPAEPWVGVAAHTTMMIAEMALDLSRDQRGGLGARAWAGRLIELIGTDGAVLPCLPRHSG